MTQAAHTPGPWKVSKPTGNYIDAPTGGSIAALTYGATKADARLIAAAPELLAALADLVRVWDENNGPDPIPEFTESGAPRNALIEKARAAITKAKGE